MTVVEYALYRAAGDLLSAAELATARELARKTELGDRHAERELRRLILRVVFSERKSTKSAAA
jgi:hypothetical protein